MASLEGTFGSTMFMCTYYLSIGESIRLFRSIGESHVNTVSANFELICVIYCYTPIIHTLFRDHSHRR